MSRISVPQALGAPLKSCLVVALICLSACGRQEVSRQTVDSRAVLPPGVPTKETYARYYVRTNVKDVDDTPFFTTSAAFDLKRPRAVWVGVLIHKDSLFRPGPPGLRAVRRMEDMPQRFHGGCQVVNLVADAATGETLSSWCNIDDGPPNGADPTPIPFYNAKGSPFA